MQSLSRREREVMQILYNLGEALATDVQAKLEPGTRNAATRKILTSLMDKGVVRRRKDGRRYVYQPVAPVEEVGNTALQQVLATFFNGSFSHGLLGMIELGKDKFTKEEIEQIRAIVKDKN